MKKVVVSIVSHRQGKLIQNLLASLEEYLIPHDFEVSIVITENLPENLSYSSNYEITIIKNLRPKGFGQNHNAAFEHTDSDYFWIVNPDIVFIEKFDVKAFTETMNEKMIDVTSPIICNEFRVVEDYKRSDLSVYNLVRRRIFRLADTDFDWYAGMFLIVRSVVFRQISGFDPKFFMYVEDCDFCARARSEGYIMNDTNLVVVQHAARRSSHKQIQHMKWHLTSLIKYWFS